VDEAALVLGVDVGARFLRGALCDLSGTIRARRDDALDRADADEVLPAIVRMRDRLAAAAGLDAALIDAVVVGLPGVVEAGSGEIRLASNVSRLEGRRFGAELEALLGQRVTVENDVNLAALGEGREGVARGATNFFVLSVGTGLGGGLVLGGELQHGQHGAAGEMDFARAGVEREHDPSADALSALAAQRAAGADTVLAPPYDPRAVFEAARAGDAVARAVVEEEAVRIARHIVAIAAVADVGLVVLGGGIGANPELLDGIRARLADWLYYPPRVELSSLGDGAVLAGALAVGLRSALDSVFLNARAR
jgi:predicted NBD/HSP70 family sugar kinase